MSDQNVDGQANYAGGADFSYDNAGRLTGWWGRDPATANAYRGTIRYDDYTTSPGCATAAKASWGRDSNRLEQRVRRYSDNTAATLLTDATDMSCYDNADRLSVHNPASGANPWVSPVYDSHGNLTSSGIETRGYDSADRHLSTTASTDAGGSAPTVVATSKVQAAANSGSLAVPKPAGLAIGDLIVVFVTLHPWYGISGPSGFTQVQYLENWNTDPLMQGEFWSKTATAADVAGTGWTFTVSGPPDTTTTAAAVAIRGAAISGTSTPAFADGNFDNAGGGGWSNANSNDNSATSLTIPQVTTGTANDLRLTLTASNVDGVTFTPPAGFTENLDTSYATGRNIEIAAKAQPSTGASGQPTVTATAATGLTGYHLTIRPAPAAGSTTIAYNRDVADRVIERKLGGVTQHRYTHTAAGDSPTLTLDAANNVIEKTITLPGGVLWTKRTSGDVWSYPNLHGDIATTTNATGVKQGATRTYDPYGNPLGTATLVDNSAGNWDYTWHGAQQRPLEHEPNLTPTIEMGARQYSTQLGRFLQTDPIEGGTPNDYTYPTDPINSNDLNGLLALGMCVGGSAAFGLALEGVLCWVYNWESGRSAYLATAGLGGGGGASAGISSMVSSTTDLRLLEGVGGCTSASIGYGTVQGCVANGYAGKHIWTAYVGALVRPGLGGTITATYTREVPRSVLKVLSLFSPTLNALMQFFEQVERILRARHRRVRR